MGYNSAVKTDAGNELLSRVAAGETTVQITKIAISDTPIDSFVAKKEMQPEVTKFTRDTKVGVIAKAEFSNVDVVTSFDVNTIAIYAKDGDNVEILFSYITAEENPAYMEAYNGSVPQPINIDVECGIWLDDGSAIIIDPTGAATKEWVTNYVQQKLDSRIKITLPADDGTNYTTKQDKDGVDFYKIRFTVAGMTATYNGTQPLTPTMVDPEDTDFSIAEWEEIRDTYFPMIMACFGRAGGYVDVYLYDLPDQAFDVYLYGV